ncbi:MAG TPA: hypothetical protein VFD59_08255 [Nocardioidaceae bacterium]|nr:hypothetical protein [Nocardioidaceae bacterium]
MHHLGIGTIHARKRVLAIADDTTVTVIALDTAQILSTTRSSPRSPTGATLKEPRSDGPGF